LKKSKFELFSNLNKNKNKHKRNKTKKKKKKEIETEKKKKKKEKRKKKKQKQKTERIGELGRPDRPIPCARGVRRAVEADLLGV
jgi:sortase (surface protein transpeptidase)